MMILTLWISSWQSSRSLARWAPSYKGTGLTQRNCTIRFDILDGPVFVTPDASLVFLVFGHEDVEGGLWASLCHAPLPYSFAIGHLSDFLAWSSSVAAFLLRWYPFPWSTRPKMTEPGPSSLWAWSCSCLPGTCPYRASFGDFMQISIVLHLWPIEPVDRKYYNH
jgi:hypothetical protein